MRNLNECQAEVFRRSEKRIKEKRQRRNRALALGVPLMLCVAAFSVVRMQPGKAAAPEDNGRPEYYTEEQVQHSVSCQTAIITVTGHGFSRTYTEASKIQPIFGLLYSYGTVNPESMLTADEDTLRGDATAGTQTDDGSEKIESATTGYTITLVMEEGGKTEYYLTGNTLRDVSADEVYLLTKEQADELRELLGITGG